LLIKSKNAAELKGLQVNLPSSDQSQKLLKAYQVIGIKLSRSEIRKLCA